MNITRRPGRPLQTAAFSAAALWFAWWCGRSVALSGNRRLTALLLLAGGGLLAPAARVLRRRIGNGLLALEVPLLLLLTSTLVFRERTADALAFDPLDPAAQIRVLCVGAGGLLGMFALLSPHHVGAAPRIPLTTLPFRIYLVYVGVVLLGIPDSVKPALTTYRAAELIAGCFVLLGAYRVVGSGASARIEATLYRFTAAVIASVWVGRVLFPDEAVNRPLNEAVPLKWELVGVYPRMAANTVGALGMLLALWSLARWVNARPGSGHRGTALAFTLLGVATTIGAQYRTGYVGLVAGGLILFVLRRPVMAIGLLAIVAFALVWSPSLVTSAQPYVLRGQTPEEAQQLSGRTDFWAAAIPVWKESPIIGKGLWTASRYEVLVPLGLQGTASVHSTWVEALVGTGVLGVSLLGAAVLLALRRGWRVARAGPFTTIGPLVLLVAMSARSITGNLFESFGHEQLVFLAILLALEDPTRRVSSRDASDSSSVLVRAGAGP